MGTSCEKLWHFQGCMPHFQTHPHWGTANNWYPNAYQWKQKSIIGRNDLAFWGTVPNFGLAPNFETSCELFDGIKLVRLRFPISQSWNNGFEALSAILVEVEGSEMCPWWAWCNVSPFIIFCWLNHLMLKSWWCNLHFHYWFSHEHLHFIGLQWVALADFLHSSAMSGSRLEALFLHPATVDLVVVVGLRAVAVHVAPSMSCRWRSVKNQLEVDGSWWQDSDRAPLLLLSVAWCKPSGFVWK